MSGPNEFLFYVFQNNNLIQVRTIPDPNINIGYASCISLDSDLCFEGHRVEVVCTLEPGNAHDRVRFGSRLDEHS